MQKMITRDAIDLVRGRLDAANEALAKMEDEHEHAQKRDLPSEPRLHRRVLRQQGRVLELQDLLVAFGTGPK